LKNVFVLLIFCSHFLAKAQIILEHTVDSSQLSIGLGYGFKSIKISEGETKYFVSDTITNTFTLYNLDFTPFISNISVPEPFFQGTDRFQALYITRTLFDCDSSNIEFAYYAPGNINKTFSIVRTDGTILFQLDSANGPYGYGNMLGGTDFIRPIINTESGTKLFLQSFTGGYAKVYVYALCGNLPNNIFDFTEIENDYVTIFPNPTAQELNFQFNNSTNLHYEEILIYSSEGKEIKKIYIGSPINNLNLDIRNFESGIYSYSIKVKDGASLSGKFIINK
jgi:hypothetical protein